MLKVLAKLEGGHFVRHFDCFFVSLCRSRFLFDSQVKMKEILHENVSLKKRDGEREGGRARKTKIIITMACALAALFTFHYLCR